MGRLILVLGGARSGKSSFARQLAKDAERERSGGVVYIATAEAGDEEMRERIERHRRERPDDWDTVEEPIEVAAVMSGVGSERAAVIVDCLALLISNLLSRGEDEVFREVEGIISAAHRVEADVIVVSNEVGMGIVPPTRLGRLFRDVAGRANQLLARVADEVYFMLAGLPQKIK